MNNILRKHYTVIIISITLSILAIGAVGLVFSQMSIRTAKTIDLKERLMSYQINKKAFNDESAKINSLEIRLLDLEKELIQSASVPELLSKLESLAEASRVEFEITDVQTTLESETAKLIIEYKSSGSYSQVFSLFEALQRQGFQVAFRKLYIFSEEGESASSEISGTLLAGKTKKPLAPKEVKWQGVATIEIVSFQ